MANNTSNVALTTYRPAVKISKPMFYQTNKSRRHTQRNLAPVSHPPTTVIASHNHPHITSGTGALQKKVNFVVKNVDRKATLSVRDYTYTQGDY